MSFKFNVPSSLQKGSSDTAETEKGTSLFGAGSGRVFGGSNSIFGGGASKRETVQYDDLDQPADKKPSGGLFASSTSSRIPASLSSFQKQPGSSGLFASSSIGKPIFGGANRFKLDKTKRAADAAVKDSTDAPARPPIFSRIGAGFGQSGNASGVTKSPSRSVTSAGAASRLGLPTAAGGMPSKAMKWTRKPEDTSVRARSSSPSVADSADHKKEPKSDLFIPSRDRKLATISQTVPANKDRHRHVNIPLADESKLTRDQTSILHSLFGLHGRCCPTDFERYQLMDERDKLLCRWRDEQERLNFPVTKGKAKAVVGECSSMCSERELYVREVQKRISPYECDEAGLDTSRLIKEYARSAADQEKPLAHELRSKELLVQSMVYLLTQILDRMPEQSDDLAGWYDFLWSRTRAIRKEITQTMLTDEVAVALVERCTRLHILCGYLLCFLEVEKFDQKMNTENLGKSLQTLRHLYDDLDRSGIHCETEAEFRAYDVMLHLHDTNVLRQVLSYRKEVRDARPVRLAIQLASAMQTKNYVRFFRILRSEGTFLQCCLCHRFFGQVRSDALSVMVNAFNRDTPYPVDKIVSMLAFDDRQDAIDVLDLYGIALNDMDSDNFVLNRDLMSPDVPLKTYKWMSMKIVGKLSETVYGPGSIPSFPPSQLPNSFDDNDCYTRDPVLRPFFEKYAAEIPKPGDQVHLKHESSFESKPSSFASASFGLPKPSLPPLVKKEVVQEFKPVVVKAEPVISEEERAQELVQTVSQALMTSLANDITKEVIRKAHSEALAEARAEEELRRRLMQKQKEKEEREATVKALADNVLDDLVRIHLKKAVDEEYHAALLIHADQTSRWIADRLWEDRFLPSVDKQLKVLVKKTYKEELTRINEGLDKFRSNMSLLWLRQFWDAWREKVLTRRKFRDDRKQAWANFTPNWNSQLFNVDGYRRRSSPNTNESGQSRPAQRYSTTLDVSTSIRLCNLKERRSQRIVRWAFNQWRETAKNRVYLRRIAQLTARQWATASADSSRRLAMKKQKKQSESASLLNMSIFTGTPRVPLRRHASKDDFAPLSAPSTAKVSRLASSQQPSYAFLHPDDSVFLDHHSPRDYIDPSDHVHRRRRSHILNSTAMTWHTDVAFGVPDGVLESPTVSIVPVSSSGPTTPQVSDRLAPVEDTADLDDVGMEDDDEEDAKDFTILPAGSLLTQRDMAVARRVLEYSLPRSLGEYQLWSKKRSHVEDDDISQPIRQSPDDTTKPTELIHEAKRNRAALDSLERSAADLLSSMREQEERMKQLITKTANRRTSL